MCAWTAALALGCVHPPQLARHAGALPEGDTHAGVEAVLSELEDLHAAGWIDRIRDGTCRRVTEDVTEPVPAMGEDVIAELADVGTRTVDRTPPACAAALASVDRLIARRAEIERDAGEPGAMEPFRRAVRDVRSAEEPCVDTTDAARAIVAVVRHVAELDPRTDWRVSSALQDCTVPSLGRPIVLARASWPDGPGQTATGAVCVGSERSEQCEPEGDYVELWYRSWHHVSMQRFWVRPVGTEWRVIRREDAGTLTLATFSRG